MNQYGLTDEEKRTHLQKYNHALFKNSLSFMDVVWEINIEYKTIVILEDKGDNSRNLIEIPYDDFVKDYRENRLLEDETDTFNQYLTFEQLKSLKDEVGFSMHFRSLFGEWNLHRVVLTPAVENDKTLCVYLGAIDIHGEEEEERKKQEALQKAYDAANRANEAKSEFLFRMSHDIRTPMNAIVGMTAIAAAHLDDREYILESLQKISISSKHLLGLINEVLDMSKIESGKLELQELPFNVVNLTESIAEIVKPQMALRKHEFIVTATDITHGNVLGDSQLIQQALMNLLSNAYKYTPDGGKINLSVTEKPTGQPTVGRYEFVVEDNGIGMSEEFKTHIFEPFERSDDERVKGEQGTGLGLAIAKSVIQMMGGIIEVESELDEGTKFIITFFLKLQEKDIQDSYFPDLIMEKVDPMQLKSTIEDFKGTDLSKKRILIAEDNEINAEIAIEILEMTGLSVEHAWNGKEALDMLQASEDDYYDLVFMDIQMPELNGYEATQAIRASERAYLKTIPIIAMSANAYSEDVKASIESGMNEHISKPLDFDYLLLILNRWLNVKPKK